MLRAKRTKKWRYDISERSEVYNWNFKYFILNETNIKKSLEYVSFLAYKKNLRVTKISDEPCLEFTQGSSFLWDTSLVVDKINEKT